MAKRENEEEGIYISSTAERILKYLNNFTKKRAVKV